MSAFLSLGRLKIMIGGNGKVEDHLMNQLLDWLEVNAEEREKVACYYSDHNLSSFFTEYESLGLSELTKQKIETIKLLIE